MTKRILMMITALVFGALSLAAPASADGGSGGDKPGDGKDVTLCHYDGSNDHGGSGKYSKITISVSGWYGSGNGNSGHRSHTNDIWEAFSYINKAGDTVNVPAQGDTSLLAFDDCQQPKVDEKIAKPDYSFDDECGTEHDTLTVASGRGYTVGDVVTNGLTKSVTVALSEGFRWNDNSTDSVTYSHTFTDEDCGLPNTGGVAQHATMVGVSAVALLALIGGGLLLTRRRTQG